jgi:UDP-N-acetylmuramyl pentapeptide phosphotransferase/UDP-N-acetylglucosamine-1-phosphate transferase
MQVIDMSSTVLVAMAISCAVSMLIVYSQRWHGKHSMDHDLSGVQKFHTTAVPRVGGFALFAGFYFTTVICISLYPRLFAGAGGMGALKLLAASLPVFAAGITEDLTKRVSVKVRLAAAIISALIASMVMGATVDELDIWGVDALLKITPIAIIVTAIVVAGGVNAINIIDGFNGLAGSVVVIMSAALGFLAWQAGDVFVTSLALLGIGVTLGFLLVNFPSGRLFLGDGGAYLLGFWVAEIAVLLLVRNASVNAWQVLAVCAYPVIEVLYSMYRKKMIRNMSPGEPDGVHLHMLVYRRFVPRFVAYSAQKSWIRNAAVTCVIAPCITLLAIISVVAGGTIAGAAAIVVVQVWLYLTVYSRLVRGRWRRVQGTAAAINSDVNATLS